METVTEDTEEVKLRYDSRKPICRVCLSTEKHMKSALKVQKCFKQLAKINVSLRDGMPRWVCIECAALLKKASAIRTKMLESHDLLMGSLMRRCRGYIDSSNPELDKHKAPLLGATETLVFDSLQKRKGYHNILQHKQSESTPRRDAASPTFATPHTPLEMETTSDLEDDPLESYRSNGKRNKDTPIDNTEEELEEEDDLEEDTESSDDSDVKNEIEDIVKSGEIPAKVEKCSTPEAIDVPWSGEKDRALIEFVRAHSPLYNPRHALYKVPLLKRALWRDAALLLQKDDSECYKRWCYVRDYYIRRRGKARGGEAAGRRARLLAFLDRVPAPQRAWVVAEPEPEGEDRDGTEEVKTESLVNSDPWEGIRIGEQSLRRDAPWDGDADDALIELVRRRPALYDARRRDYRRPGAKRALWAEVAAALGQTETACYKRWCYIRDYFVRRRSNPGALSSGKAARRRASRLAFLRDCHTAPQKTEKVPEQSPPKGTNSADLPGYTALRYRLGGYSKRSSPLCWTGAHDEALIAGVRARRALWDARAPRARSARAKHALWGQVAAALGRTETDCCRRWSYIRDYYVRRRGKPGVLSVGHAAQRRAEMLAFLDQLGKEKQDRSDDEVQSASELADTEYPTQEDRVQEHSTQIPWTSDNDATLIDFVKQNEPLYNPKNRNAELKMKLWSDIGSILDKTDSECYKRWCYVRDYYIRRRGKARGGEAAGRRARLLAFLDRVPAPQRGK